MAFARVFRFACCLGGILLVLFAQPSAAPSQQRGEQQPVPGPDQQAEALRLVRDVYKAEFDRAVTPGQKREVARKLLKEAGVTRQDPTGRYVLYDTARRIATEVCDVPTAYRAIDESAKFFQIDAASLKSTALAQMAEAPKAKGDRQAFAEGVLETIAAQVKADDYTAARALAEAGMDAARKSRDGKLIRSFEEQKESIAQAADEYREIQDAIRVLAGNPNDPAANLAAGSHYCFRKDDWTKGLPMLARADEGKLKELAAADLKVRKSQDEMADLADGWHQIATQKRGTEKTTILARAAYWYETGLRGASGLTRQRMEKGLANVRNFMDGDKARTGFTGPKQVIATDDHDGATGFQVKDNIYVLTISRAVPLDETAIFFQARGHGGPDTAGTISFSLDADIWTPIGEWTPAEIEAGATRQNWHRVDFSTLHRDLKAARIFVKFDYTGGREKLVISGVAWSYEGK